MEDPSGPGSLAQLRSKPLSERMAWNNFSLSTKTLGYSLDTSAKPGAAVATGNFSRLAQVEASYPLGWSLVMTLMLDFVGPSRRREAQRVRHFVDAELGVEALEAQEWRTAAGGREHQESPHVLAQKRT